MLLPRIHKVKFNTKRNWILWKTFFYKRRNCCDFFIFGKKKMLHQQILFPQNGKVFNDLYYVDRVENTRDRNLKMCLFPRTGKKSSYFLFLYLFISTSTKWETFHQWCYFHEEKKNSIIYITPKK